MSSKTQDFSGLPQADGSATSVTCVVPAGTTTPANTNPPNPLVPTTLSTLSKVVTSWGPGRTIIFPWQK